VRFKTRMKGDCNMAPLKIGSLANRTGTNVPTIRYYEEIGLLPRAGRQSGGQRIYGEDDVWRLTFIRRCRDLGLPIQWVKSLVALAHDGEHTCMDARDMAQEHLTVMRSKLKELKRLERSIARFVASCDRACAGGPGSECTILDSLGRSSALSQTAKQPPPTC
jgi:DNA-binding transcriptional MerR regulator